MKSLGILLLVTGCVTAAVGLLLIFAPKLPWLGRLPGDLHIEGRHTSFHFPVVTCLILSVVLTVLLNLALRLFRR